MAVAAAAVVKALACAGACTCVDDFLGLPSERFGSRGVVAAAAFFLSSSYCIDGGVILLRECQRWWNT